MIVRKIVVVLTLSILSSLASAQLDLNNSTILAPRSGFGFVGLATYGSSLLDNEDPDYTQSFSLRAIPRYRIDATTSVFLDVTAKQEFEDERESKLSSGFAGMRNDFGTFGGNDQFMFFTITRLYAPIDRDRAEEETYRGAIYFRPSIQVIGNRIGLKDWTFTFRPNFTQNFHEFEAFNGKVNTERNLNLIGQADYVFTDKVFSTVLFGTRELWSYQGNRKQNYLVDASVSYQADPQYGFSLGYSIDESTTTPTGADNVNVVNNEVADVYLAFYYLN